MQLSFDGKTKEQKAIELLKRHEPESGYYLAFSGGKDSQCLMDVCQKAKVRFDAHYSVTGIDPPELVQHIKRNYPEVKFEMPQMSIWRYIEHKGLPTRTRRWCCEKLKENGGKGRVVLTGIRWEESLKRQQQWKEITVLKRQKKVIINPLLEWTLLDVWTHIDDNGIQYCRLYDYWADRLGCIMCPMAGEKERVRQEEAYPKIRDAWHRAALRYWEAHYHKLDKTYGSIPDGEDFWKWWLSGKSIGEYSHKHQFTMAIEEPQQVEYSSK